MEGGQILLSAVWISKKQNVTRGRHWEISWNHVDKESRRKTGRAQGLLYCLSGDWNENSRKSSMESFLCLAFEAF